MPKEAVLLPRGRALALSAPGGRGARARSRTARGPPPRLPQTRRRGHERGSPARPPRSILGRPRALSPAAPPRARRLRSAPAPPLPPPKMASRRPSPGSALPPHNAARLRDVTGPPPGGGARRGALRTRRKGALGRGGTSLDSRARGPRCCARVSRGLVTVCQAPSSRVRLPGARRRGPEGLASPQSSPGERVWVETRAARIPLVPRCPRILETQSSEELPALPSATQASHEPRRQGPARAELPAPQPRPAPRPPATPEGQSLQAGERALTQQPARSAQAGSGEAGGARPTTPRALRPRQVRGPAALFARRPRPRTCCPTAALFKPARPAPAAVLTLQ
ncbi:translation initiation factor IF-2-like [Meles meles]|uniref:translation initiation factor IF-2-like n=1 Tax=Meles meles TaxID=9662 RepID=UPI001E69E193|nr:translation initiation factor IF-2-like [Meles meles]